MAIRLRVKTDQLKLKIGQGDTVHLKAAEGIPIYPRDYTGAYTITPTTEAQTLPTAGLMATQDIIVNAIPNNYGLISWNGSTLTVS